MATAAFRCGVVLNICDNSRFVGSQVSHVLFFVFVCGLQLDLVVVVCVVGLVFLFFVAPFSLLAVFNGASAFNQDVSKWNTGAVTSMAGSKCTVSPSLWPRRLPLWCVVEYIRQLEVRRITILIRIVLFVLFVV